VAGKKSKQMERRLMKDFQIGCVENLLEEVVQKGSNKDIFSKLAKAMGKKPGSSTNVQGSQDAFGRRKKADDQIGSSAALTERAASRVELRRQISETGLQNFKTTNVDEIVKTHPKLEGEAKGTKVAFVKFAKSKERVSFLSFYLSTYLE